MVSFLISGKECILTMCLGNVTTRLLARNDSENASTHVHFAKNSVGMYDSLHCLLRPKELEVLRISRSFSNIPTLFIMHAANVIKKLFVYL